MFSLIFVVEALNPCRLYCSGMIVVVILIQYKELCCQQLRTLMSFHGFSHLNQQPMPDYIYGWHLVGTVV